MAVGTGSATDEFFLEELAGAANLELVLSAERAAKGIVPAVDVAASGTRHEEKLLAPAEGAVVGDLRKQLAAADSPQAVPRSSAPADPRVPEPGIPGLAPLFIPVAHLCAGSGSRHYASTRATRSNSRGTP